MLNGAQGQRRDWRTDASGFVGGVDVSAGRYTVDASSGPGLDATPIEIQVVPRTHDGREVCTGPRRQVILTPCAGRFCCLAWACCVGSGCTGSGPLGAGVVGATVDVARAARSAQSARRALPVECGQPTSRRASLAPDGEQWLIHDREARPRPGDYVFQFDGCVAGPGANERRVLPNGDYRIVLEAAADGRTQQAEVPLAIRDADTAAPDVTDLALQPDHISPNFDARDDVTHINYRLAKDARVSAFLDRAVSNDAVAAARVDGPGDQLSRPVSSRWSGMGSPVACPCARATTCSACAHATRRATWSNGAYRWSSRSPGVPEASIVAARIGPLKIIRGEQVCVDAIVRNTGQTVLRTEGPDPGYVYNSHGHVLVDREPRVWRARRVTGAWA